VTGLQGAGEGGQPRFLHFRSILLPSSSAPADPPPPTGYGEAEKPYSPRFPFFSRTTAAPDLRRDSSAPSSARTAERRAFGGRRTRSALTRRPPRHTFKQVGCGSAWEPGDRKAGRSDQPGVETFFRASFGRGHALGCRSSPAARRSLTNLTSAARG